CRPRPPAVPGNRPDDRGTALPVGPVARYGGRPHRDPQHDGLPTGYGLPPYLRRSSHRARSEEAYRHRPAFSPELSLAFPQHGQCGHVAGFQSTVPYGLLESNPPYKTLTMSGSQVCVITPVFLLVEVIVRRS